MMDPNQWARDYAAAQYQRAGQMDQDAQQMLLSVFNEEAARQRPYITAPLEMQMFEKKAQIQRRYGTGKKSSDEEKDYLDLIIEGGGSVKDNGDGTLTVTERGPDGKELAPYKIEKMD